MSPSCLAQPVASIAVVPLADVLALAKPYPNLLFEIRAELVRAGLKRDAVTCTAPRFASDWTQLRGGRHAPYACRVGPRTLTIGARRTVFDGNGHKLAADDPSTRRKAARLVESGLTWRWR